MKCSVCGTEYDVHWGVKGSGCPDIRNHPRQVRLRVKKLLKIHGVNYVKELALKIPKYMEWKKVITEQEIKTFERMH